MATGGGEHMSGQTFGALMLAAALLLTCVLAWYVVGR